MVATWSPRQDGASLSSKQARLGSGLEKLGHSDSAKPRLHEAGRDSGVWVGHGLARRHQATPWKLWRRRHDRRIVRWLEIAPARLSVSRPGAAIHSWPGGGGGSSLFAGLGAGLSGFRNHQKT